MVTNECAARVFNALSAKYGMTRDQVGGLYRAFRDLDDDAYEAAFTCYMADPQVNGKAPSVGEIKEQIRLYTVSMNKHRQDAENKKRYDDWKAEENHRKLLNSECIKGALAAASETRRRLVKAYGLDLRAPQDMAVVMGVLAAAEALATETPYYLSPDEAVELAHPYLETRKNNMKERDEWLAKCNSVA